MDLVLPDAPTSIIPASKPPLVRGAARSPLGDLSNVSALTTSVAKLLEKGGVGAEHTVITSAKRATPTDAGRPPPTTVPTQLPCGAAQETPEDWVDLSSCNLHVSLAAELRLQLAGHGDAVGDSESGFHWGEAGRAVTEVDAPMLVTDHCALPEPPLAVDEGRGSSSLASSSALTTEADSEALLRGVSLPEDEERGHQEEVVGSTPGSTRASPSPATYCSRKLRHLEGMLRLSVQRLLQVEAQKRAVQAALQREIAALQLQLSGVLRVNAADLTAAQGEAALLRLENERKARRIEELQRERAELIAEVEWCRAEAQQAEARSAAAEADFQRLRGGLEAKDSTIVELHRRNERLQQELDITRFDHRESKCMLCNIDFTLFRRPHHCRKCHRVACNHCAPEKPQPNFLDLGPRPTRVCTTCLEISVAEALGVM